MTTVRDKMYRVLLDGLASDDDQKQIITTDEELLDFVETVWGVHIPAVQVCEHHVAPARAFCDAYFARSPVSVWHGSRGFAGKSFLLALLSLTEAVTLKADVNLLGGSGEQSKRILTYMDEFWKSINAPREILASDPTSRQTRLTNGATIQALMASQRSVRGPHPQRLRLDEIDEMDIALLDAAMGQTLSKPGVLSQTVMSSTRQYADGTMTEMLKRAAENSWPIYEWCYRETLEPHGWLSQRDVDEKRATVTAVMWTSEYELQEPSPDLRAIQADAVAKMFDKSLGEAAGALHENLEFEPPMPGAQYTTGADWARKKDYTEIVTFRIDCRPARLVAFLKTGRLDWPVMVNFYNERIRRYRGLAFHDGTGIGDVIAGYIKYPATGVIMVGRARSDLLSNYIAAIENDEIRSPYIASLRAEHQFASVADVFSSADSHHLPDGISASALAWMAIKSRGLTEDEIAAMGRNEIDTDDISPDLLAALQMSGMSIDFLKSRKSQ